MIIMTLSFSSLRSMTVQGRKWQDKVHLEIKRQPYLHNRVKLVCHRICQLLVVKPVKKTTAKRNKNLGLAKHCI